MRLLFISRSLPFHHMGGMEAVAWDLARILVRRGHEVEILTTRCSALPRLSDQEGVRIRTMDVRSGRYSRGYWDGTSALYESVYRSKVDLVLGIGMGAYGIAANRKAGDYPPVLMQSHGQPWGEFTSKLAVSNPVSWLKSPKNILELPRERVLRRFDRVIAVGPAVAAVLSSRPTSWMLGKTPVSVVRNGIDSGHFTFDAHARVVTRHTLGIKAAAPVIMSACRLHIQKGVREALDGVARARELLPNLAYIIAGSGPMENVLRGHAERLGIGNSVHFVGAVDRNTLPRILSAADAFLFTSKRREGLALGPLEAAATGLPCIISKHLAVPEMDAAAVDPDHPDDIAEAIVRNLSKETHHGGGQRPSRLSFKYSLDHSAAQYEELFAAAICGGAARSGHIASQA